MTSFAVLSYHAQMLRLGRHFGAAAAILLVAAPARAGELDDVQKAHLATLLRTGAAAATAKQWDACIQAYSSASALDDTPVIAGELGLCEEQAGRFADAYRHLRRAKDAAPPELKAAKAPQWKRYEAAMARARKHLAILFITVSPTQAAVLLDGRPIGRADGRHLAIEPGTHTVSARLEGYEDAIEPPRTWNAGDIPHVHLELKPKPAPPAPPAASKKPPAPSASAVPHVPERAPVPWYLPAPTPRGVLVPLAYAGLATTIASGATAIALEVDRRSLRDKVSVDMCRPAATARPEVCDALAERAGQRNVALGVTVGAAIATGVLAGAARLAFGFERGAASPTVAPTVNLTGGGIVMAGTW